MRAAKDCPYCERSNVAGCNINKNIYSDHLCFDFIRKRDDEVTLLRRGEILCPGCILYNRYNVSCRLGRSINSRDSCFDYKTLCKKGEDKMEAAKFYVFNPKKGLPKQTHNSLADAESEARRIAELEQDTEILIVQAVVGITHPSKQFIYRNYKK